MAAFTTAALVGLSAAAIGEATGQGWDFGLGKGIKGMFAGPDIPKPPEQDAPVSAGEEGIRRGGLKRVAGKRALGQLFLTRGQNRSQEATLGSFRETLG